MERPNTTGERGLGDESAGKRQGEACPHPVHRKIGGMMPAAAVDQFQSIMI